MPNPAKLPQGVVNLQGKAYPTWAFTLDTAHQQNKSPLVRFLGLTSDIVQLPTTDNGMVAVVKATAHWLNADGDKVTFDGIGDATPANCGPVGKSALLRMADTRAKGRALRDSVKVGDVLEEELGGDDAPAPATARPPQRASQAPAPAQEPAALDAKQVADMRLMLETLCEADLAGHDAILKKEPAGLARIPDARVAAWVQWMRGRAGKAKAS